MRRCGIVAALLVLGGCSAAEVSATPPAETFRRSCSTAAIAAAGVAQAYLDHRIGADAFRAFRLGWQAARDVCQTPPAFGAGAEEIATAQVVAVIAAAAALTGEDYAHE